MKQTENAYRKLYPADIGTPQYLPGIFIQRAGPHLSCNPICDIIIICGIKVEEIDDPMTKKMRQLDKLLDELATGKPMEKVMR